MRERNLEERVDCLQVRKETLWNNKNIIIGGKSIFYKDWHALGIERVKDLLNNINEFIKCIMVWFKK